MVKWKLRPGKKSRESKQTRTKSCCRVVLKGESHSLSLSLSLSLYRYWKNVSVEGDQGKPNVEFTQDGVLKAAELKIMNLRPGLSKQLVWEEVSVKFSTFFFPPPSLSLSIFPFSPRFDTRCTTRFILGNESRFRDPLSGIHGEFRVWCMHSGETRDLNREISYCNMEIRCNVHAIEFVRRVLQRSA